MYGKHDDVSPKTNHSSHVLLRGTLFPSIFWTNFLYRRIFGWSIIMIVLTAIFTKFSSVYCSLPSSIRIDNHHYHHPWFEPLIVLVLFTVCTLHMHHARSRKGEVQL